MNLGCRCEACRAANSAYQKALKARLGTRPAPTHGASGYTNYGCRCDVCREANRAACAAYKARRGKAEPPAVEALATELPGVP